MKATRFTPGGQTRTIRRPGAEESISLRKRRHWFDQTPPAPDDTPDPKPEATTPPATPPDNAGEAAKFTQADVDRLLGERAKRAAESATNKILASLGFESVDDLKKLVTTAKERAEAELSEAQKLQKQLETLTAEKQSVQAQLDAEKKERIADKRNAAVLAAASEARAVNSDDVLLWAEKFGADHNAPLDKVINDEGQIDKKAIEMIITAAKKERPNYFQQGGPGSPSNRDGQPPQPDVEKALGDRPLVKL
jgi:hypothetical protein